MPFGNSWPERRAGTAARDLRLARDDVPDAVVVELRGLIERTLASDGA
jgi:hypothetical protein